MLFICGLQWSQSSRVLAWIKERKKGGVVVDVSCKKHDVFVGQISLLCLFLCFLGAKLTAFCSIIFPFMVTNFVALDPRGKSLGEKKVSTIFPMQNDMGKFSPFQVSSPRINMIKILIP